MLRIKLLILLLSIAAITKAQQNKHTKFYISKIPEFKEWLDYSNIGDVIAFDTIEVKKNKINLLLNVYNKKENKLYDKDTYFMLDDTIKRQYNISAAQFLFDKFYFLMDLKPDTVVLPDTVELEININTQDAFIDIWKENNELVVDLLIKMGGTDGKVKVQLKDIKGIKRNQIKNVNSTIGSIKTKLITQLRDSYKEFETVFEDYKFKIKNQLENELDIEISNVKEIVIRDESFFEHLDIKFLFFKENEAISIFYTIRGKYASGFIWSPKNDDYYDMTPKYHVYLDDFSKEFENKVDFILKN